MMKGAASQYTLLKLFHGRKNKSLEAAGLGFQLRLGPIQPAIQPSFLLSISATKDCDVESIHIQLPSRRRYEYINLDWINGDRSKNGTLVAIIRLELDLRDTELAFIACISKEHGSIPVAHLSRHRDLIKVDSIHPAFEATNLLDRDVSSFRQIFIGGVPKSGTTWVLKLLNSHPDVLISGENAFWEWPTAADIHAAALKTRIWSVLEASVMLEPFSNVAAMCGYGRAALTCRALATIAGTPFVGDKTPGNSIHLDSILTTFPRATVVHCIRHPFDVAVSRAFHEISLLRAGRGGEIVSGKSADRLREIGKRRKGPKLGELLDDTDLLELFLAEWCRVNTFVQEATGVWGNRIHTIRYEELASNPPHALNALLSATGVKTSSAQQSFILENASFSRLAGGRAPGVEDSRSFFRKGVMNDYLRHMPVAQQTYAAEFVRRHSPAAVYKPYLGL